MIFSRHIFPFAGRPSSLQARISHRLFSSGTQGSDTITAAERAVDTSARQMGLAIAVLGAAAYYVMNKYGNVHELDHDGSAPSPAALSSKEFLPFKLGKVINVNHNTNIYRFNLAKLDQSLDLPVASFVLVRAPVGDTPAVRPYTPISSSREHGHFDLMIKNYPTGPVSSFVANMKPGDYLDVKGPIKKLEYESNKWEHVGMVAGGTGITPMLQILEHTIRDPNDKTKFTLIYANLSPKDILLKDRLDRLAKQNPARIQVHYIVDKADESAWSGPTGYVSQELLQQYMPSPKENSAIIFVCGPPGMMDLISGNKAKDYSQGDLSGLLKNMGYTSEQVFKF